MAFASNVVRCSRFAKAACAGPGLVPQHRLRGELRMDIGLQVLLYSRMQ